MSESLPVLQQAYRGCPLCEGPGTLLGTADCSKHSLWNERLPPTIDWMLCDRCGHVHTRDYWTPAGLAEIFRHAHDHQQAQRDAAPEIKRAMWSPVVDRVIRLLGGFGVVANPTSPAAWMDVGCGDGALVMTASDYGFSVIGLDSRAETAARIRSLGFQAHHGDFMEVAITGRLDVLSLMDVLEHLPYPRQALAKAAQVLRPGGVLVVSMPDMSSSRWKAMDAANDNAYWWELEHHHNFTRNRLATLLRASGFDVADFALPIRYKAQMEMYAIRSPARA